MREKIYVICAVRGREYEARIPKGGDMNNLTIASYRLRIATESATQAIREFSAEIESIRSRYTLVIWWLRNILWRLKG